MMRYRFRRGWAVVCLALVGTLAGVGSSRAQDTAQDPIAGQATVLRLQNQYISLVYGRSGTPALAAVAAPDTNVSGRWGVATVFGDPDSNLDDNRSACAWNFLSYQVEPQLESQADKWYRLGNSGDGTYRDGPVADQSANTITSTWDTSGTINVNVSQGGSSSQQQQPVGVAVEERLTLMRDMVRVEYRFVNSGGLARRVRARIFMDPLEESSWIIGRRRVEFESQFQGGNVPDEWRLFSPLSTPEVAVRGILNSFGATVPNRFVVGSTASLANSPFNYVINPNYRFDGDPDPNDEACQAYWDTFMLLPGQSRSIVTYVGLGSAESDPTPPYVLAVQTRRTLGFVLGDNPDTANPEPSYPSPRRFTIRAFLYNVAEFDINNASAFITLPKGLTLVSGQPEVRQIGTVLRQSEVPTSWEVELDPSVSGRLTFTVTASGVPVASKTVTGSIEVPAQATRKFSAGLALMSVPFQFANPDTPVALNQPSDRIRLARWDSTRKRYAYYPDSLCSTIQAGAGYWYRPDMDTTLVLRDATPVPRTLTANYVIPIKAGWNMIGAPYVYEVPWGNTRVSDGQTVMSLTEAAAAGWLRPTLFSYNTVTKSYQFANLQDATLTPWEGYWLRAERDAFLIVPPVTTPDASVIAPDQRSSAPEWRIQIAASARGAADLANFAGVSRTAPDDYDLHDIDEPPVPGEGYVSLRFVHNDWGRMSGYFTQDIRNDDFSTAKVWEFEVDTDLQGEDVTLTWPGLNSRLPRGYAASIEDVASGRRVYLRTQGSYTFQADSGPRKFRLTITRAAGSRLAITGLEVTNAPGRAGARNISFQLSGEAVADVRILAPSGRVLREVAKGTPVGTGRNSVIWDGTNSRGARLTSGIVLVEVTATAPDGAQVRDVRPHVIVR